MLRSDAKDVQNVNILEVTLVIFLGQDSFFTFFIIFVNSFQEELAHATLLHSL